jgi:hypothetical protein
METGTEAGTEVGTQCTNTLEQKKFGVDSLKFGYGRSRRASG